MAPESSPDLIQPVIGFRRWLIKGDGLWSAGLGQARWAPGRMDAVCKGSPIQMAQTRATFVLPDNPPDHPAPQSDCGCGLYARHKVEEILGMGTYPSFLGAVALWGNMEVHRAGIRAQHARIVVLTPSWDTPVSMAERLSAGYGVPLVAEGRLEEEGFKHGIKVPEEMIPAEDPSNPIISWAPQAQANQTNFWAVSYSVVHPRPQQRP